MSLILCPECGTKISDKATTCPHCGYISKNPSLPISVQDTYEIVPSFGYDIEEWNPNSNSLAIGIEDNKKLVGFFGKWKNIELKLPAIAQVVQDMAKKENILVAKMDNYVKKLIEEGVYRFSIDKNGEILPTIRDAEGIVKQVRLEEIAFTPDVLNSLNNLSTQAAMTKILDEIEYVGDSIRNIHIELQNDRIALAESARAKLLLATKIQDTKLREMALLEVVSSATEAKCVLMRNFSENLHYIAENSEKSEFKLMIEGKKGKGIPQRVEDSFQDLISITNSVQIECEGYALVGEYEASRESLKQFQTFIKENKLDDRDTLLLLNANTPEKKLNIADEFMAISKKISAFDSTKQIYGKEIFMLEEGLQDEEDNRS